MISYLNHIVWQCFMKTEMHIQEFFNMGLSRTEYYTTGNFICCLTALVSSTLWQAVPSLIKNALYYTIIHAHCMSRFHFKLGLHHFPSSVTITLVSRVTVIGQCDRLTLEGIPCLLRYLKFNTTFTRAPYWTLSSVKWYHSTSCTLFS